MSDRVLEELFKFSVPLYVIVLSIWAGTVYTVKRVKNKELPYFSLREWVGDIVISSFIGIITYLLCKWANIDDLLGAVCIAISAHMGTRAITLFENLFIKRVMKLAGEKDETNNNEV